MSMNELQIADDIALITLCSALNFDYQEHGGSMENTLRQSLNYSGLNNPKGFKKAAAIVAEFKELIDPIIRAHMDRPAEAVPHEQKLVDEINRITTWKLERLKGSRWEICPEYVLRPTGGYASFKNILLAVAGRLLLDGAMEKLRKCRNCEKYIRHTGGRLPEFCAGLKCRNEYFNTRNLKDARLRSRVSTLVRLAKKKDIDLNDSEKKKILPFMTLDDFSALRDRLNAIASGLERSGPEHKVALIRERLPKEVCDRLATPRQKLKEQEQQRNRPKPKKRRAKK